MTSLTPSLQQAHIALYDIDAARLRESRQMLDTLNTNINAGRARISTHLGVGRRREALKGAHYVVNAVQVGGYRPSTVIDFEIPKRYGLRQTIADTLGIGGIFRGLRTIPVMQAIARDMQAVCPDAWFLNYVNPMCIVTGALLDAGIRTVGLCHSVQGCAGELLRNVGMADRLPAARTRIAGINHQAWLLEIRADGKDLYPAIKRRYPDLIKAFNIPLDEYPRRCVAQIARWQKQRQELVGNRGLTHTRSHEYGARIMDAIETGVPARVHGNIRNHGFIPNLSTQAIVEVPCLVDSNGMQGCFVGDLPEQCAGLNRTNINVQLMTLEAAASRRREAIYQAALLDPHTAAELSMDEIVAMCDDLIKAHGRMLPAYR